MSGGVVALTTACLLHWSAHYGVPVQVMYGILAQEAGQVGMVRENTNGTKDRGPFQINDVVVEDIAQVYEGVPKARLEAEITNNGCFNAMAAAWNLQRHLKREMTAEPRGALWRAIASFHSRRPEIGAPYAVKVAAHVIRIFGPNAIQGVSLPSAAQSRQVEPPPPQAAAGLQMPVSNAPQPAPGTANARPTGGGYRLSLADGRVVDIDEEQLRRLAAGLAPASTGARIEGPTVPLAAGEAGR